MMLKFFLTLFLIAGGIAESDICDDGYASWTCEQPNPKEFPETNEELQKICVPGIKFMECSINYTETCENPEPGFLDGGYRILATAREVCSEDTLLHAAVVDNLKCYAKLVNEDIRLCGFQGPETDLVQKFAAALIEEGLVSLTDNENDTHKLHRCITPMNFFACQSLVIERACGNVAMDAYVEIVQKAKPGFIEGCTESYEYLPTIIRLRKAEEEKERSIAEAFRKRK